MKQLAGSPGPRTPRLSCGGLRRARGQSLVEFALAGLVLFLLIFVIIDVARLIQAQVTISNAARQAVRYAVTGKQERTADGRGWITRTLTIERIANDSLAGL